MTQVDGIRKNPNEYQAPRESRDWTWQPCTQCDGEWGSLQQGGVHLHLWDWQSPGHEPECFQTLEASWGGSHGDGEWGAQKRTMRWENEVCLPTFPHPEDGRAFRDQRESKRGKGNCWAKNRSQRLPSRFPSVARWSQQHRYGYSRHEATVQVICLNYDELPRSGDPQRELPGPRRAGPALVSQRRGPLTVLMPANWPSVKVILQIHL